MLDTGLKMLFVLLGFSLALVPSSFLCPPLLSFGMGLFTLCVSHHCVFWKYVSWFFILQELKAKHLP